MSTRYIPELDGLRAIAALVVVAFHVRLPGVLGGFLGVDVFFVLSGYLTASITLSGRFTFRQFMTRRLRRLWPLLLVVSAAFATLLHLDPTEFLPGAIFLGNFAALPAGGPLVHTWTIGAELQFYAAVAALALALDRPAFRAVCATLFLTVTAARIGLALSDEWRLGFYSPVSHSSGLFLGAALATLPLDHLRSPRLVFSASAAACIAAFVFARFATAAALVIWISIAEIASAGMIAAAVRGLGAFGAFLRSPPMRGVGVLSFGLYLWHYPIAIAARGSLDPATAFALTTCASLVLAAFSYRLIEAPFRTGSRPLPEGFARHALPVLRRRLESRPRMLARELGKRLPIPLDDRG